MGLKFEKLPLGIVEEKGTGTIKKLFVDDVDSLELLLAHSVPEGIANLLIPLVIYIAMFCADWKLALMSLASIPDQPALYGYYVLCWNEAYGTVLSVCTENEQHNH